MNSLRNGLRRAGLALALLSLSATGQAQATDRSSSAAVSGWPVLRDVAESGGMRFSARARGTFGGRRLAYRATLEEAILKDRAGKPATRIFSTSFIVDAASPGSQRPVLFAFNGGPGGASNALMFGAFGPKRLARFDSPALADPGTPLIDNAYAPLDQADVVFIDPPETGFGRPLPGTDPTTFRSSNGDAYAVSQFILHWLTHNGRLQSPVYLAGESYGTHRAILVARDLFAAEPRIAVAGLVLISQAIIYNGPAAVGHLPDPMRAITRLPDVAGLAWYHGLIDNTHQTLAQALDAARSFARHDYAAALIEGNGLPATERERVAGRLEALIGPPRAYWLSHNLRIGDVRRDLLASRGLALAQFDGRETEALNEAPADADRDWNAAFLGLTQTMERFARQDLHARSLEPYRTVVPDPYGFEETWSYLTPPQPGLDLVLQEQMRINPRLRVLAPLGLFDTTSSPGATEAMFAQFAVPDSASRIALTYYAGGHMLYSDEAGLAAFSRDVRRFVAGDPIPSRSIPTVAPAQRR